MLAGYTGTDQREAVGRIDWCAPGSGLERSMVGSGIAAMVAAVMGVVVGMPAYQVDIALGAVDIAVHSTAVAVTVETMTAVVAVEEIAAETKAEIAAVGDW